MTRVLKRFVSLAAACILVLSMIPAPSFASARTLMPLPALPEGAWQKTAAFPDWKGYTDDTLAMNSTISFRFWHGQGSLCLHVSDEVESFRVYINGQAFDTTGVTPGFYEVDFSDLALNGVNTLQVSNILPLGLQKAVTAYIPYPVVLEGTPEEEGIRSEPLQLISDLIESDIARGFPSAQLAVIRNGRLVFAGNWGQISSYEKNGERKNDSPMVTSLTMYDLASVTKMFATVYALQKLVTDGLLNVNDRVADILGDEFLDQTLDFSFSGSAPVSPQTQREWKSRLTVQDLLLHQAGFPATFYYYIHNVDPASQSFSLLPANSLFSGSDASPETREATYRSLLKTPLSYEPRSKTLYSDLGYMLLGFIVEKVSGQRLDELNRQSFWEPMGLTRISFTPLEHGFRMEDCAATELNGNTRDLHITFPGVRTETLQGQVHDEKAYYSMGGISGHAGLFASASDLARLASVMLTGGYGQNRFFSNQVLDYFTSPGLPEKDSYGEGWQRQGDDRRVWYFGTQADRATIGHQGWAGTLAMIDPARELVVVYLTNKINSPVTSPSSLNSFDGSWFTASTLGFVPQLLSMGLDDKGDLIPQLLDLLADMAAESIKRVAGGAGPDHPSVRNVLSKIDVLRKWAERYGSEEHLRMADTILDELGKHVSGLLTPAA